MTVLKKAILSFLLSIFLFSSILAIAYTGFFSAAGTSFYNPSAVAAVIREAARDAEVIDDSLFALQRRFSSLLRENSIRGSFSPDSINNSKSFDTIERSRIFGKLMESVPGLNSIRFIDSDGITIHYSTYQPDFAEAGASGTSGRLYRSYAEDAQGLPIDDVYMSVQEQYRLAFNRERNEIIFSFPFFDSSDFRLGVALFAISLGEVADSLSAAGRMGYGDTIILCPSGIIKGYPELYGADIFHEASLALSGSSRSIIPFNRNDNAFALVSAASDYGFRFAGIVKEETLVFPKPLSIITIVSIFLTIFLIIFFIFNLRQASPVIQQYSDSGDLSQPAANSKIFVGLEELESVEKNEPILVPLEEFRDMIYEQNGIPYINNEALDRNPGGKLNSDFMELIDSVVTNRNGLTPPSPRDENEP